MDFRITDAVADPVDTAQTFTEELLRLPGCFLCYTPAQGDLAAANHQAVLSSYNGIRASDLGRQVRFDEGLDIAPQVGIGISLQMYCCGSQKQSRQT